MMGCFRDFTDTLVLAAIVLWTPWKSMFLYLFPKLKKSLNGEIILLTGAGHGLGKELALKLSELGAILVLWDINKDSNEATAAKIRDGGHHAYAYRVDVTNESEVIEIAERVKQEVGDVTIIINNAGVFSGKPFLENSNHTIRLCFEVNIISHFWILRQFLPYMLEKDKGHIVAIASVSGHIGTPFAADYGATKYATVGLMDSLAMEFQAAGKKNIKFTTVSPGIMETGLVPNSRARFPTLLPILLPENVAKAVIKGILNEEEKVFMPNRLKHFLSLSRLFNYKNKFRFVDYIGHIFSPSAPPNEASKQKIEV